MTVYLLCFSRPGPGGARHYIGFSDDVDARVERHIQGRGAKLTRAMSRLGIGLEVVRTWDGDRALEKRLKSRHQAARLCPRCRPLALSRHAQYERRRRKSASVPGVS